MVVSRRVTDDPAPKVVIHRREHLFDGRIAYLTVLFVVGLVLLYAHPPHSAGGASSYGVDGIPSDTSRRVGHDLMARGLYAQALDAYERWLLQPGIDASKAASLAFSMGDIARERLNDYERAVRWYLAVTHLDPNSPHTKDAGVRIVECLERLGHRRSAQAELERITSLRPREATTSPIVARVGERHFSLDEVEEALSGLEPQVRLTYQGRKGRLRFLQERFLVPHVLAEAGRRQGLQRDPKIRRTLQELEDGVLAGRIVEDHLRTLGPVAEEELELWYRAEAERYRRPASQDASAETTVATLPPLAEIRSQVYADYDLWRRSVAVQRLVAEQIDSQQVFIDDGAFHERGDDES